MRQVIQCRATNQWHDDRHDQCCREPICSGFVLGNGKKAGSLEGRNTAGATGTWPICLSALALRCWHSQCKARHAQVAWKGSSSWSPERVAGRALSCGQVGQCGMATLREFLALLLPWVCLKPDSQLGKGTRLIGSSWVSRSLVLCKCCVSGTHILLVCAVSKALCKSTTSWLSGRKIGILQHASVEQRMLVGPDMSSAGEEVEWEGDGVDWVWEGGRFHSVSPHWLPTTFLDLIVLHRSTQTCAGLS